MGIPVLWERISKLVTKCCKTSKSEISSGVEILYIFNAGFFEFGFFCVLTR